MKSLTAGMAAMVIRPAITLAFGMRVERADGEVFGFTDHPQEKTVSLAGGDLVLNPRNAISVSSIVRTMGSAVDNLEATVVGFDDVLSKIDLMEGRWDAARFQIFQFDWKTPENGVIWWLSGKFGNVKPKVGAYVIELRDLRQELQNDTTRVTQANCDYRFGDPDTCTVDKSQYTFAGSVTDVASNYTFTDATFGAVDADYYTEGEGLWTSGNSAGLRFKIREHAAGGAFTLAIPTLREIQVGDEFTVTAGCRKRRVDCRDKFDNVLNFPGFDMSPTTDTVMGRTGGAPTPQLEEPLVSNPQTPDLPEPGSYTTWPILGLDYTQDYSSGTVDILAPARLVIRGFSTASAASDGESHYDDLVAINPDVELGQYVAINEMKDPVSSGEDQYTLWQEVNARNWWARASYPAGAKTQWTTTYGNYELNPTAGATANGSGQRLPQYKAAWDFAQRLDNIQDATWVFTDNCFPQSRVTADYDQNGTAETPASSAAAWRAGYVAYVTALRALRPGLKVIANVNHDCSAAEYVGIFNAGFMEGVIGKPWGLFATQGVWAVRARALNIKANTLDGIAVLSAFGESTDYQRARFGLTMAMSFDAWFCYIDETGPSDLHSARFDEYEQELGVAIDAVPSAAWSNGVLARRFEGGLVLCNPTSSAQTVDPTTLGTYARFLGTQDATTNDGSAVSGSISIPAQDGLVLLAA